MIRIAPTFQAIPGDAPRVRRYAGVFWIEDPDGPYVLLFDPAGLVFDPPADPDESGELAPPAGVSSLTASGRTPIPPRRPARRDDQWALALFVVGLLALILAVTLVLSGQLPQPG
jgi:hypothetical protein